MGRAMKIIGIRISGKTVKKRNGRPGSPGKVKPDQSIPVREPDFHSLAHGSKPG